MHTHAIWGIILTISLMGILLWLSLNNTSTRVTDPNITTKDKITCSDFYKQEDAQDFFERNGGNNGRYKTLDKDHDGTVCEGLSR